MSTWGTGIFASDGAQDFLEELAELEADDRVSELKGTMSELLDDPSRLMRTVFPESLIAAAAMVALSLPGGHRILERQSSFIADAVSAASLNHPAPELVPDALQVLAIAAGPDSPWSKGWRLSGDREEALAGVGVVKEILKSARYVRE